MRSMFLFFSHSLTPAQIEEAKDILGVEKFIEMDKKLQDRWSNVPPEVESLKEYSKPFVELLKKRANRGDFVLLSGDFGLCNILIEASFKEAFIPIYATTKRDTIEKCVDGAIVKKSLFRHIRFRRYEHYE